MVIAVPRNRVPLYKLHHEVRSTALGFASVQDCCDVRMAHKRQGLAFCIEARDDLLRVHAGFDNLQCYLAAHCLHCLGLKDNAEATTTNFTKEFILTDLAADRRGPSLLDRSAWP